MDHGRIVRLLKLMQLLCSNVDYTIEELSDKLKISKRSIFRYLDSLRLAGFAVIKKGRNVHKLLEMPVNKIPLSKLIHITDEEAHILHNLLGSLTCDSQVIINLEEKLSALFKATSITEIIGNRVAAENIMILREAIDDRKQVKLVRYESGNTMTISDRIVEPIRFSTNYTDIYAYEVTSGIIKTFKILRIGEVEILNRYWEFEKDHCDIDVDCFRMAGKQNIPVTLKMSLKAKNLLIEEYPLSSQHLSFEKDCWWLRTTVKDLSGVGRFYLGLSDQIQIVESPELEDHIRNHIRKNLAKYI